VIVTASPNHQRVSQSLERNIAGGYDTGKIRREAVAQAEPASSASLA